MRSSSGRIALPGVVQVVERTAMVIRTRLTGRFDDALCSEFISTLDEWRGSRTGVAAFHDATGIIDYDVAARDRLSRWTRERAEFFDSIHILVERRIVAWGLNILSMVSGTKMVTHHSREDFEEAFARYSRGVR